MSLCSFNINLPRKYFETVVDYRQVIIDARQIYQTWQNNYQASS